MPDAREARLATNESRFREINERVERDLQPIVETPGELLPFVCECGLRQCSEQIELSLAEYDDVRRDSTRFAVAPGHEIPDVEDVVERSERYFVIRKRPQTWDIVQQMDPRR